MKKIYICSALHGDIQNNIEKAKKYCEYAVKECGAIPVAPHIYFTLFLNDDIPEERNIGKLAGMQMLNECDELWYFGDRITKGMIAEIIYAKEKCIPVKYISDEELTTNKPKKVEE